jgi:hypothetical protein
MERFMATSMTMKRMEWAFFFGMLEISTLVPSVNFFDAVQGSGSVTRWRAWADITLLWEAS